MKKLSLLVLLFLALFGCRNDIDEMNGGSSTVEPPIIIQDYDPDSELVTGTVFGRVFDEQENPIENALIKYDGQNYTTDEEGRFFIEEETLDKQGTFLTVEADGFFKGSRRFNPQDSSVNYVYVQLLALNEIGTFDAADGAELEGSDGLGITFPPNSIQSASGALYNGQVSVAAKWLDPTADNIGEIMPGNLLGLNSQIEEVALISYGMAAVELFGDNGEKLNIAEGQTATLSFPVPQEILNTAPATIPLWSFEEEQFGIWAEEGSATLINGMYVGEVSHFSFWNCDVPFPLVFIEGQLTTEDGTPLANTSIRITPGNQSYGRWGYTDNDGYFAGKMPKGEDLVLSVGYAGETCLFSDINLGSFDIDTNLGQINLEETGAAFTIQGTVIDCDNNPVNNGLVRVQVGNTRTEYYLDNESSFDAGILNCNNETVVSITVVDLNNLEEGIEIELPITQEVDFGTVMACGTQLTEFFTLNVGGKTATIVDNLEARFELPETSEYPFMSIGRGGQDSTNIDFVYGLDITLQSGVEGTYDKENIDFLSISTFAPFFNATRQLWCQGDCQALSSFQITITENGGVDGYFGGEFNGEGVFSDAAGNTTTSQFNGIFRVPIN